MDDKRAVRVQALWHTLAETKRGNKQSGWAMLQDIRAGGGPPLSKAERNLMARIRRLLC